MDNCPDCARKDDALIERTAQIIAHRACAGSEHDPQNGKIHGFCVVCVDSWPCEYAGKPPAIPAPAKPKEWGIVEAVDLLAATLDCDKGYRESWKASIAMAFKDEWDKPREKDASIHEIANTAAENFLRLLCYRVQGRNAALSPAPSSQDKPKQDCPQCGSALQSDGCCPCGYPYTRPAKPQEKPK